MKVAIAYIFPLVNARVYEPQARRFALQYMRFPPGETDHQLYVIANGGAGKLDKRQEDLFSPLVPAFLHHNNAGRDIGGFIMAARHVPCDLLVCMGAPARPRMACWLDIIVRAVENNGPGLYGPWAFHVPAPHIRTTVFAISPQILNAYPITVDDSRRYHFEHSHESITMFCMKKGFPVLQTTARGVFSIENWHHVEQKDSLFADQHTDSIGWQDEGSGW